MKTKVTIHDDKPSLIVGNTAELDEVLRLVFDEARSRGILCAIRLEAQNGNEIFIVLGAKKRSLASTTVTGIRRITQAGAAWTQIHR